MFFRDDALSAGNGLGPDEWWKGAVVYQIYPRLLQGFQRRRLR